MWITSQVFLTARKCNHLSFKRMTYWNREQSSNHKQWLLPKARTLHTCTEAPQQNHPGVSVFRLHDDRWSYVMGLPYNFNKYLWNYPEYSVHDTIMPYKGLPYRSMTKAFHEKHALVHKLLQLYYEHIIIYKIFLNTTSGFHNSRHTLTHMHTHYDLFLLKASLLFFSSFLVLLILHLIPNGLLKVGFCSLKAETLSSSFCSSSPRDLHILGTNQEFVE